MLAEKVTAVGNQLGLNDYFGPILRVTSKIILDEEVTKRLSEYWSWHQLIN